MKKKMNAFVSEKLEKPASSLVQTPEEYFMEDHGPRWRIFLRILKAIEIVVIVTLWCGFLIMALANNMLAYEQGASLFEISWLLLGLLLTINMTMRLYRVFPLQRIIGWCSLLLFILWLYLPLTESYID